MMRAWACSIVLGTTLVQFSARAQSAPGSVVFTGTFITLDSTDSRAHAVGVRDGVIAAVGSLAHVDSMMGAGTAHIALPGFALPGFADAHAHPQYLGEQLEMLDLHGLSKAQLLNRVARAARQAPAGAWIRGGGWDQAFWADTKFPIAASLDSASAGHPVVLDRIDGHSIWVNSRALALAATAQDARDTAAHLGKGDHRSGWRMKSDPNDHRPDPSGGQIIRDRAGAPTGVLLDSAMALVTSAMPQPTRASIERQLRAALEQYRAWGLTSVHDAGVDLLTLDVWRALADGGRLTTRMYVMVAAHDSTLPISLARGIRAGAVGDLLTIRSVKVVLDGALGSRGAQLAAPYADDAHNTGLSLVSDATLDSIITLAIAHGFQVNVHAIGDLANRRVLDAFARAEPATRALRFRVEHASLVPDDQLPRFAALGVIASIQPVFIGEYGRFAEARVGEARLHWAVRTKDLLEHGARIASGTDYPASDTGDPIMTLYSMVTRHGADGRPHRGFLANQRVSVAVALRSMTQGAAFAAFQETMLGAITVGRAADFTVLSRDPYAVPAEQLRSLRVLRTIVAGRVVYERPAASR